MSFHILKLFHDNSLLVVNLSLFIVNIGKCFILISLYNMIYFYAIVIIYLSLFL